MLNQSFSENPQSLNIRVEPEYPFFDLADAIQIPEPKAIEGVGEQNEGRRGKGISRMINSNSPENTILEPAQIPKNREWNFFVTELLEKIPDTDINSSGRMQIRALKQILKLAGIEQDLSPMEILTFSLQTHTEKNMIFNDVNLDNPYPVNSNQTTFVEKPKLDKSVEKLLQLLALTYLEISLSKETRNADNTRAYLRKLFCTSDDVLLLTSKLIRIPSQNVITSGETLRGGRVRKGISATSANDSSGGLNLILPSNIRFENIDIIESTESKTILRITESRDNGKNITKETYDLEYGKEVKTHGRYGELAVKIICSSGSVQTYLRNGMIKLSGGAVAKKPVIYFRNFEEGEVVKIKNTFIGSYDVIYPDPSALDGSIIEWSVLTSKNDLISVGDKSYPYLFWDGKAENADSVIFDEGFCVSKNDVVKLLEKFADTNGLDESMKTDFVTFWTPLMKKYDYYLIKLLSKDEINTIAKLDIQFNKGFELNRMYFAFKGLDKEEKVQKQNLKEFEFIYDKQPTIIEWGGFEID